MTEDFEVRLDNLKFYSRHGLFEHETRDGNEFEVSLSVRYHFMNKNETTDDISDTVSYADLYEIVKKEMLMPRRLLETVAYSIASEVKQNFPFVTDVVCKVIKLQPPIRGFIGNASVTFRISDS